METVPRLIEQFIPTHYDVSIDLQREARTFSGTVTIHGEVVDGSLSLHSKDLAIDTVVLDGHEASFSLDTDDTLTITSEYLHGGTHQVTVGYHGSITDGMHGLYPCYYEYEGAPKELIATQFESHHAREVFPCIDEPEAKATFRVTLTTEAGVTVLGNMPVASQREEDSRLITRFEQTPRMSTYLLAWVVGELHKKTARTKNDVEVNVWATPAQPQRSLDFALDIAVRSIEFYDEYFGTPYPLPKSDHVALPDFSSGAMENWGLITYREICLLADPATTGISGRQYIATVVAHELAHQWFGNLVTMKWWNNLWLNESFANMMEYVAVDHLHPEWNVWLDFATNEVIGALRRDAIDGVQSVQTDVHHPDEINTLFDPAIVYAKGGRLLRMLEAYIGEDAFQRGLKQYFARHAYQNTDGDDLWRALSDASGKDVAGLMHAWISQPGYPVVSIDTQDKMVTLTQEQFFIGEHEPSTRIWPIPLAASSDALPTLMSERQVVCETADLPRLNVGDSAHFITRYSEELMAHIHQQLRDGTLTPLDKVQLIDETTLLARAGMISSAALIPLVDAFEGETSEPVWNLLALALGELRKFVETDSEAELKLRALSRQVAKPAYNRLGWMKREGESEEDTKLRATIISMTLYGEDPDAIAQATQLYETQSLEALDPELRPLILSTVVRYGDDAVVDTLLAAYTHASQPDVIQDICSGVTSTRSQPKIHELLDLVKDASVVRPQDAARWFIYLIRSREGREPAWQWIRENWQWVVDTFAGDKSYDDYPRFSATGLTTRTQLQEYKAFFEPKMDIPSLARVIQLGIREIEARVDLIDRDGEAVRHALQSTSA